MPKQAKRVIDGTAREIYLSTKQAAAMLGVSERWLVLHQEVPRHYMGRLVRFLESELHTHFK
jgi:hypothetical protein